MCDRQDIPVVCVKKLSIFLLQKLALNQNGVDFRQQSIGYIRINLASIIGRHATSRDVTEKLAN